MQGVRLEGSVAKQKYYWTFDGQQYSYQPMTQRERRTVGKFLADWFKMAFWLFLVAVVLYSAYYFSPFPALRIFGIIVHP